MNYQEIAFKLAILKSDLEDINELIDEEEDPALFDVFKVIDSGIEIAEEFTLGCIQFK